ncbi:MAG TPA: hypothetical protein VHE60_11500 [Pyrinomonadaceae bacterium]|nr:hypothetical protein [Pyrinomonadaceae bacterium]
MIYVIGGGVSRIPKIVDDRPQTSGRIEGNMRSCQMGMELLVLKNLSSVEANERWIRFGKFVWQMD